MRTDEELVASYQKKKNQADLSELRMRVTPTIQSQVSRYIAGPGHISRVALEAKADELLIDAVNSYKPGMGAAFKTHLFNYLRRLERYTKANANIAHVPELKANMITTFTTQLKLLEDRKRRPPTDEEMADHMALPVSEIQRMRKSIRREIPWSQVASPHDMSSEKAHVDQLFEDIYYELSPDERVVFEYLIGKGRPKMVKGQDIARASGFSNAKVSMLRTSIANKMKPHLANTQRTVTM